MKFLILAILTLSSCAEHSSRNPSSETKEVIISREEFKNLKPKKIIELLKENSEMNVVVLFEVNRKLNWSLSDMAEIEHFLKDETPILPVMRTTNDVYCGSSTVAREAMHLKQAFIKGQYPLAQCSTYDLEF